MLKEKGFLDFVLCTGYLGEKIEEYFGDGNKLGINIRYCKEKKPMGTGGALKNAEKFLGNEFVVVYGDSYLDMDYKNLISVFVKNKKLGLTAVFKNIPKTVLNNVEVADNGNVLNYDKRNEGKSNYVEAGVHVFKKDILSFIPKSLKHSLEEELLPVLIKKQQLCAYVTSKKFYDIGTFERLEIFNKQINL
jgi:D-glycero-alpha-D-manno-heptose 1-phosphate guanylyltransferase